jgi:SSS family solute:Na+ symporter
MKKRPICRAGCLAAAALLSCAPLLDMKGSVLQAAAAEETVSDTLASVIVTVRGDALLATEEGASQGADYLETDEAADRTAALKAVQQRVQAQIRGFYPALEVGFSYSVLVNGFSCELPEALIPAVRQLPAVESVTPAENRSVPRMAQAAALGGFPAYYDATGCKGEEQVIAVIAVIKDAHPEITFIAQMMGVSWGALAGSFLAPFLYGLYWKKTTKAACYVSFAWGCALMVVQMIVSLGGIDVSGWGPILGYLFASSVRSGVIAMVGGLIIVPVVSLFTSCQDKAEMDELFSCYDEKVSVAKKEALD